MYDAVKHVMELGRSQTRGEQVRKHWRDVEELVATIRHAVSLPPVTLGCIPRDLTESLLELLLWAERHESELMDWLVGNEPPQ